MIKPSILVVEDNLIETTNLKNLLINIGYNVIGTESNVKGAIKSVNEYKPEIVIIDIELGQDRLGGISIGNFIQDCIEYHPVVIFLTKFSDSETIEKASGNLNATYLVKPYNTIQLKASIVSGIKKKAFWHPNERNSLYFTGKIFVPKKGELVGLSIASIQHLKANGAYCDIVIPGLGPHQLSRNLRIVSDTLPNHLFMRVHKSYTINLKMINKVKRNPLRAIMFPNDFQIPIGQKYSNNFLNWFRSLKI